MGGTASPIRGVTVAGYNSSGVGSEVELAFGRGGIWPALVGVATVNHDELRDRAIFTLLASIPESMGIVLVLRAVPPAASQDLRSHPRILMSIDTGNCGVSRARNVGLRAIAAHRPPPETIIAFPDDDCSYPEDLGLRIQQELAGHELVLGRYGEEDPRRKAHPSRLTLWSVFHNANSVGIFVRWGCLDAADGFDEILGVGSGVIEAGEDLELLVALLRKKVNAKDCPHLYVLHPRNSNTRPERAGAYLAVARRYWRHPIATAVLARGTALSVLGLSHTPRDRLSYLLLQRARKGMRQGESSCL